MHLKSTEKHKRESKNYPQPSCRDNHSRCPLNCTFYINAIKQIYVSPTPRAHFPEFRSSHIICTHPAFGWPETSANEHSYLKSTQMFLLMTMGLHKSLKCSYESWIQRFIAESDLGGYVYMCHLSPLLYLCWHDESFSIFLIEGLDTASEPFSGSPPLSENCSQSEKHRASTSTSFLFSKWWKILKEAE